MNSWSIFQHEVNMMRQITALLFVVLFGTGCATTNKQHYEQPLYEMDVLEKSRAETVQIKEVSSRELGNQKPGERPPLDSDEAGLWMVMDKAENEYRTAGNRIDEHALNDYLQNIVCRLAPEYCEDIRVYVLQVPYFNASMAPNGVLLIWSGLLLRTTNEAQLASVIGHEIGHYLRRHSLQRLHDVVNTSSALVFVQLAAAVAGVGVVGDLAYLAAISSLQAYNRDQEREADGYGLAFMARAGYDPHEAGNLWEKVIQEVEASKDKNFSLLLFDSHPPGRERMAALDELSDRIVDRGNDFSREEKPFREHLLPLRNKFLQDELHLRDFARTEVLLDQLIEDGVSLGELYYFKGELYRLRGEENDLDKALVAYEKARNEAEFPPETLRAQGLLYLKKGESDKARSSLQEFLILKPDCVDREMIMHMLSKESQ
jgi:Zn-dependent protease with chaperone function